ncbi:SAP30-binding protein [Venturia canescens]|uniref:SAP30-binding protein n=1 Tax=Venturia canescens TaxID=32260 RepID=UPI001C9C2284|nr:SAP30-binding protein [Venturia canescens]XP_043277253.1 SAP30-binding protein [Venturia canescens]
MSVQSVALASLTATYTDSEGDDGPDDEQHHHHREEERTQGRRRESSDVSQVDDSQNSNVTSHQRSNALDSPLFGRSATNSPDDESVVLGHGGSEGYNSHTNNRAPTKNSQNAPTLVTDVTSKVQRLVSYFDDTVVSDDETGTATAFDDNNHHSHQQQSNYGREPTSISRKNNNAVAQSPKRQGELVSDCEEDVWGVTIPPEPAGQCPAELQDKISNLYKKMESGLDMNLHIQQRKEFRNPSIYEKLIQFCSINEMGTNYPPDRFDPFKWGKDSYYEELARVQKNEMDKLEKARKEKTKIEIVTGTAKRPASINSANLAEDDAKRRKSKWDQVATGTTTTVKSNLVMSQPTLTTLTSSATGTKATVISAFGSLPKKRL